jgi:redox-sensitive bicupin YhaK (pirin superfamily)
MATSLSLPAGRVFRPAADRFHTQLDWLDSWHSFSFASHLDPAWMGFGCLRVINDDTLAPGRGFGMHPHRDMEIITVMVEGELHHQDSMGHQAVLHAGEVQRMSAGTGIVHSEINQGDRLCRLLQIWIQPSKQGLPPAYEQKAFQLEGGWTPLIHPQRLQGAMAIDGPVQLWRARLDGGQTLPVDLPESQAGWIQAVHGSGVLKLDGEGQPLPLRRGDGVGFQAPGSSSPVTPVAFTASADGTDLLLFALPPLQT